MKTVHLTIKQRIVLWFSLSLFIIILATLAITLQISQIVFRADTQAQLIDLVEANIDQVGFVYTLEGQDLEAGDQFINYADGYLEIDDDFCDYMNGIYTCLLSDDGTLLYGECPILISDGAEKLFSTVDEITYEDETYYVYDCVIENGSILDGVRLRGVASEREGSHILDRITRLVYWFLPGLSVLAIIVVYIIINRSFKPLEKIVRTAESIGNGNDLSQRIDLSPGKDELRTLASSYNHMFDRLEDSFQRERRFTSDVSHELRTPLAVVLAQCEYSLELAESEEEYREALESIQHQSLKMKEMISQLLFFSRLEQGREPLQMIPCPISELVEEICVQQSSLLDKNISLQTNISPEIIGYVDQRLFTRLLINLLSNASKYGHENGTITVSLSKGKFIKDHQEDWIALSVKDNGIGISDDCLPHIWDRFYQVDSSRTETTKENHQFGSSGAGLGLAMVKEIATLHNGKMVVESKLGIGSTFTFLFPTYEKKS